MIGYSIRDERKKERVTKLVDEWCKDIPGLIAEYGFSEDEDYFEQLWDIIMEKCNIKESDSDDVRHHIGHMVYDVLDEKIQEVFNK